MVVVLQAQLTDNLDEGLRQRSDTIAAVLVDAVPQELRRRRGSADPSRAAGRRGRGLLDEPRPARRRSHRSSPASEGPTTCRDGPRSSGSSPVPSTRRVGPAALIVGINFDDVTDPVRIVSRLLAVSVPAVVLILAVLTWWLTGRTLAAGREDARRDGRDQWDEPRPARAANRRPATRSTGSPAP